MEAGVEMSEVRRYRRESIEFARLVNLSDAVFAIALTLLVLGLQVPVDGARLASDLVAMIPQLVAFVLGFALICSIWWHHHKLVARLAFADGGIVGRTLLLLGAVALVPFPTGLVGSHPTSRAAVLPFIGLFVVVLVVFVALHVHAQRVGAWVVEIPGRTHRWVLAGYGVTIAMMLLAAGAALVSPIAGLVVLAGSGVPERVVAGRGPTDYRRWS